LGKRLMEHSVRARGAGTRPAHSSSIRIGFTDQRLTAYGGLAFWLALILTFSPCRNDSVDVW
jgi:hypothetical protein